MVVIEKGSRLCWEATKIKTRVKVRYIGIAASFSGVAEEYFEVAGRRLTIRDILHIVSHNRGLTFTGSSWVILVDGGGVLPQRWSEYRVGEDVQISILPQLSGG